MVAERAVVDAAVALRDAGFPWSQIVTLLDVGGNSATEKRIRFEMREAHRERQRARKQATPEISITWT